MVVFEQQAGALVKILGTPVSGRSDIVLWTGTPDTSQQTNDTMRSFEFIFAETREQMKDFRLDFHDPNRSWYSCVNGVKLIGSLKPTIEGHSFSPHFSH
jgi:hypothetical protein